MVKSLETKKPKSIILFIVFAAVSIAMMKLYPVYPRMFWYLFAGGAIIFALVDWLSIWITISTGVKAEATVLRTIKKSDPDGTTYIPVLAYTADGERFEVNHTTRNFRSKYADGEIVSIIHSRRNPRKFWLVGDYSRIIIGITFFIVGVIIFVVMPNR